MTGTSPGGFESTGSHTEDARTNPEDVHASPKTAGTTTTRARHQGAGKGDAKKPHNVPTRCAARKELRAQTPRLLPALRVRGARNRPHRRLREELVGYYDAESPLSPRVLSSPMLGLQDEGGEGTGRTLPFPSRGSLGVPLSLRFGTTRPRARFLLPISLGRGATFLPSAADSATAGVRTPGDKPVAPPLKPIR